MYRGLLCYSDDMFFFFLLFIKICSSSSYLDNCFGNCKAPIWVKVHLIVGVFECKQVVGQAIRSRLGYLYHIFLNSLDSCLTVRGHHYVIVPIIVLRKGQAIYARDTILKSVRLCAYHREFVRNSNIVQIIPFLLMGCTIIWMYQIFHHGRDSTSGKWMSLIHCSSKAVVFFSQQRKGGKEENRLPILYFYCTNLFLNWSLELHFSTFATRGCFFRIGLAIELNLIVILTDSFVLFTASINCEMEVNYKFSRCTRQSSNIPCRQMFDQYVSITRWQQFKTLSRKRLRYTSRFCLG